MRIYSHVHVLTHNYNGFEMKGEKCDFTADFQRSETLPVENHWLSQFLFIHYQPQRLFFYWLQQKQNCLCRTVDKVLQLNNFLWKKVCSLWRSPFMGLMPHDCEVNHVFDRRFSAVRVFLMSPWRIHSRGFRWRCSRVSSQARLVIYTSCGICKCVVDST